MKKANKNSIGEDRAADNGALLRTCVGCRTKKTISEMTRLKLTNSKLDLGNGFRGAWICTESIDCVDMALQKKAFSRAFKTKISVTKEELYNLLNLD